MSIGSVTFVEYFNMETTVLLESFTFDKQNKKEYENQVLLDENILYHDVDPVYDVITASVIFCVGLVLNALILRCYWSVKTSTAVYIRVLAVYDMAAVLYLLGYRTSVGVFNISSAALTVWMCIGNFVALNSMLGPLFIAIDRFVLVLFPHNFTKYSRKIRCAKIFWIFFLNLASLVRFLVVRFVDNNVLLKIFLNIFSSLVFLIQCLVCVALYAFIVFKVRKSQRRIHPEANGPQ